MFNLYICEQINKIILYDLKKKKYNFKDKLLCFNSESCYTIVFFLSFCFFNCFDNVRSERNVNKKIKEITIQLVLMYSNLQPVAAYTFIAFIFMSFNFLS